MPDTQTKAPNRSRADQLIKDYEAGMGARRNIESYWQTLHDYFYVESQDINKTYSVGTELEFGQLWDSTTLETSDVFASGFMNYLTPPSSKWARIRHRNPQFSANKAVGDFFENVMDEVNYALNRSNFYQTMFPTYKSSGVYGTSVLFEEEDIKDDIRFTNLPLKQVVIIDDAYGRINKYFIEFEYTANQAASRWGVEKLSSEMQKEIQEMKGDGTKHKFVLYIANRHIREVEKTDNKNLPVEATWIDYKGKTVVEESGYHEFPVFTHRFDKRPFNPWGFSPAMKALPFARLLQTVAKTNMRAMMKHVDPPVALPANSFLAPFNANPRATNYYRKDKMDGKDIFPFANYGDPQIGLAATEYYADKVKTMMYHDVFLAFSNITKDMNNPEIAERINEKMTMLGPAVGRYLSEVLTPTIERTIGILARRGKLPEPPPELMEDPTYEIDFVGVLAQAQRRTELTSLTTGMSIVGEMAQFNPAALDKLNPDKITDEVWAITGAPMTALRDDDEVAQIRESRAQQQADEQRMINAETGAGIAKDAGAAEANFAKAKGGK